MWADSFKTLEPPKDPLHRYYPPTVLPVQGTSDFWVGTVMGRVAPAKHKRTKGKPDMLLMLDYAVWAPKQYDYYSFTAAELRRLDACYVEEHVAHRHECCPPEVIDLRGNELEEDGVRAG